MTVNLETLGRAIKQTQYRHHRAFDTALGPLGSTLTQWDALRAIARTPGSSAHFLAGETFQSDQAFGTLANRLEASGLITRRQGSGRRIEHHITGAGDVMLDAGRPLAHAVLEASFAPLSDAEREQLLDLLLRVVNRT